MFMVSIVLFVLASVLCAMATTPTQLIVFRIIQGLGGGMVAPIGIATVFMVAPPDKRGSVMGILGIPMLLAPILGPLLSGWLIEYINWHWIFSSTFRLASWLYSWPGGTYLHRMQN